MANKRNKNRKQRGSNSSTHSESDTMNEEGVHEDIKSSIDALIKAMEPVSPAYVPTSTNSDRNSRN